MVELVMFNSIEDNGCACRVFYTYRRKDHDFCVAPVRERDFFLEKDVSIFVNAFKEFTDSNVFRT